MSHKNDFYTEFARISALLLAAIFAFMSFLLVVGVQSVPNNIKNLMTAVIATLSANLVLFAVGSLLAERTHRPEDVSAIKKVKAAVNPNTTLVTLLRVIRVLQQLVFVSSVVVVAWLAVSVTSFFYKPQPAPTAPQQDPSQSQPSPSEEPSAEPAQPQ